jgi:hypothetical protein
MEKGFLSKDNFQWVSVHSFTGTVKSAFSFATYGVPFFAYHCSNCGKIELTTTDYDKSK